MSMNIASELRDHLQTFDAYIRTLGYTKRFGFFSKNFFFLFAIFKMNNPVIMINFDQLLYYVMIENIILI